MVLERSDAFSIFDIQCSTEPKYIKGPQYQYEIYQQRKNHSMIRVPDLIWTHDPLWSSGMLYHWATGDSVVNKGQIVGIDWNISHGYTATCWLIWAY